MNTDKVQELSARIDEKKKKYAEKKALFDCKLNRIKKERNEVLGNLWKEINNLIADRNYWRDPERAEKRREYYQKNKEQIQKNIKYRRLHDPEFREKQKMYNRRAYLKRKAAGYFEKVKK